MVDMKTLRHRPELVRNDLAWGAGGRAVSAVSEACPPQAGSAQVATVSARTSTRRKHPPLLLPLPPQVNPFLGLVHGNCVPF